MNGIDFLKSVFTFITPKAIITTLLILSIDSQSRLWDFLLSFLFRCFVGTISMSTAVILFIRFAMSVHERFSFPAGGLALMFSDYRLKYIYIFSCILYAFLTLIQHHSQIVFFSLSIWMFLYWIQTSMWNTYSMWIEIHFTPTWHFNFIDSKLKFMYVYRK